MKMTVPMIILLVVAACTGETPQKTAAKPAPSPHAVRHEGLDVEAPLGTDSPDAARQREQERLDQQWRDLQSFRAQQAVQQAQQIQQAQQAQQEASEPTIQFATGKKKETFKGLGADAINSAPVTVPIAGDVAGPSVLKAQVYLDRLHFSVGVLDGRWGRNSAISVWWWQHTHGLKPTGEVDEATFRALARGAGYAPPVTPYTVTADDTKGPFTQIPDSPYDKAKLDCLCYQSIREELAEKFHASEDFLALLNPGLDFSTLQPGGLINVPNVRPPQPPGAPDIAKVIISVAGNSWSGFDASGNLIFHAPTTLGSTFDPSPDETVKVVKIIANPHFHYDPTLYHDVPDTDPDAHLNPGPNSPVGVVWMALSKPHYGMHGTPDPDSIGYTSSHGCVRLTNWDAAEVSKRIAEGTSVEFVDPSSKGLPAVAKKGQ
jgi:lipoprotein-anchoring transpeptidase ErfK/SrfK